MGRRAYGVDVDRLGEDVGWACWICGGQVDRDGPAAGPHAPSVDHVVPRARGGTSDPGNLRLAHRRCNARRGSAMPELEWPRDVPVIGPAPLWPVLQRALRRRGDWEVVGLLPTAGSAGAAREWLGRVVPLLLGGRWEVRSTTVGADGAATVSLRALPEAPATAPGRVPVAGRTTPDPAGARGSGAADRRRRGRGGRRG